MQRPTLIVAEAEPREAISVRKLVLETAKFNVLTAHSTQEAIEIFHSFANVSAVVLADDDCIDCDKIEESVRSMTDKVPIIYLSPRIGAKAECAEHTLSSHEPEALLALLRSMLGDPREIAA